MNKRIVIITGANSGIGKQAVIKFASHGYQVIMACRNLEKSKEVQKEAIEKTKNNDIDLMQLDISSFESIQNFSILFKKKYQRLDVLIHNAALLNHGEKNYQLSKDNIELSFATNTVGPFLLTHLLLEHLKKSFDPRILNACTTNIRHFLEPKRTIDFDNLQGEYKDTRKYSSYKMYGDSKMALLLLTFKMAVEFKDKGIKVNAIQIPSTKMSKDTIKKFKPIWRLAAKIQNTFNYPQETIANTYYEICTSDFFKDITGKLINEKGEIVQPTHYTNGFWDDIKQFFDKSIYPKYADSKEHIDQIWNLCVKWTKKLLII